jgi:multidrug efflux pump subunit AcrA (membrane-fusion protein)
MLGGPSTAALLALVFLGGCGREVESRPPAPRPVTVFELVVGDPTDRARLSGVVESWAQQEVAFEVPGRVTVIAEEGTVLEGRWVEADEVVVAGEVLARIDQAIYQAALTAATAEVAEARINLDAALPAKFDEATAHSDKEDLEFDRTKTAHDRGAATDIELATAKARRDAARAGVREAQAAIESGQASLHRAGALLQQADIDLANTVLYAPFTAEVSEVYTKIGGYAQAGQPVAELVMMDPIQVDVTVSADTARRIALDDAVRVSVAGRDEFMSGKVYRKSTVANAATRTFTITVMLRNERRVIGEGVDSATSMLPRVEGLFPVSRKDALVEGPLFVDERRGLHRDGQGHFIWVADDIAFLDGLDPLDPSFAIRKIRVVPGDERMNYQGIYLLRELAEPGDARFMDALVLGVPASAQDGDRVALIRKSWVLRPGDLVEVRFERDVGVVGLYVPMPAIIPDGHVGGSVFIVRDGRALEVGVTLHEVVGELQRIEGRGEASLTAGDRVITQGASYVKPGEDVSVVEVENAKP